MVDAWYNLTAIDFTDPVTFIHSINSQLMFNMFGNLILLMIFAVIIINLLYNRQNNVMSFTIASFVVAILSVVFFIMDIVPNETPFICWGIFAIGLAVSVIQLQ